MKANNMIITISFIPMILTLFPIPKSFIYLLFGLDILLFVLIVFLYPKILRNDKDSDFFTRAFLGWITYNIGLSVCVARSIFIIKDFNEQNLISIILSSSEITGKNIIISIVVFLIVSVSGYCLMQNGLCSVKRQLEESKNIGMKEERKLYEQLNDLISILNNSYFFIFLFTIVVIIGGTLIGYLKYCKSVNTALYENIILGTRTGFIFESLFILVNFISCKFCSKIYKYLYEKKTE